MRLSLEEVKWLVRHGDRSSTCVLEDERGKYVEMYHPKQIIENVYLERKETPRLIPIDIKEVVKLKKNKLLLNLHRELDKDTRRKLFLQKHPSYR